MIFQSEQKVHRNGHPTDVRMSAIGFHPVDEILRAIGRIHFTIGQRQGIEDQWRLGAAEYELAVQAGPRLRRCQ